MKKLIIILTALLPLSLFSQNTQGEVAYEEKMNLHIELPEENEQIRAMLPEFRIFKKVLYFNEEASLYKDQPQAEEEEDQTIEGGDGNFQFKMKMTQPDNKTYTNLADNQKIDQKEFMGKKFLIIDESDKFEWKLTGQSKTILDFPCMQATYSDTNQTIVAWFTPQIPISSGPGNYGRLPGLILEVDINDGKRIISAKEVKFGEIDASLMEKPSKGKKVNSEEFHAIMEEKMKEMQMEMGGSHGSGGTRIIIRN